MVTIPRCGCGDLEKLGVGVFDYADSLVQNEYDVVVFCAHQFSQHMFYCSPMLLAGNMHISSHDSYGITYVRPCCDHCKHERANSRCVRYRVHSFPLQSDTDITKG